jgi:hypothetical protein
MKRILFPFAAALVASVATYSATTLPSHAATDACSSIKNKAAHAKCETYNHSAPGDEYFGKMKMSYLGINNTHRDETIRAGANTVDSGIINKVGFADDALDAWQRKYPLDPDLARSFFLAIRMHQKIYTQQMQERAWTYMHLETTRFGSTYFGKLEKAEIARGFTEHYYGPAAFCGVVTPAPLPTPSPKAGDPKVEILDAPCVPGPTPEVTSSPMLSPSATPSPHS